MKRTILLLTVFLLPPGLGAQDFDRDAQDIERRRKAMEDVRRAAEEADKRPESAPLVTFQDVLKDPDDIPLNFRYAQSQVSRGRLKGASATLERILMVKADLPKVRLLYAVVLFKLGSLDDAEREFKALKEQAITPKIKAELEKYVKAIRRQRRRTHWTFTAAAGFDFDENRNSAPASGKRLVADVETILDEASTRQNDTTKVMSAGISMSHDLGYQAGHLVFASANYYRAEQTKLRTLNLQSYSAALGLTYKAGWLDITPSYDFSHVLLAETTYIRSHGGKLRLSKQLGSRVNVNVHGGCTRQDYNRTEVVATGNDRTGDKYDGGFGVDAVVGRASRVGFDFTHTSQGAEAKFNSYFREAVTLSYTRLLRKGRFLMASATADFDKYNAPDPTVSTIPRDDHTWRPRLTYGTPLGGHLLLTLSYEYFHADSNLLNNSYTNNKVSSLLTFRWGT